MAKAFARSTISRTLVAHQAQDVAALVIFLVIAIIINVLVGRAQAGMTEARSREQEAISLYELTTALAGARNEATIARLVAEHVHTVFGSDNLCLHTELLILPHFLLPQ